MLHLGCFFKVLGLGLLGVAGAGIITGIQKGDPIIVGMSVVACLFGLAAIFGGAGATQTKQLLH